MEESKEIFRKFVTCPNTITKEEKLSTVYKVIAISNVVAKKWLVHYNIESLAEVVNLSLIHI